MSQRIPSTFTEAVATTYGVLESGDNTSWPPLLSRRAIIINTPRSMAYAQRMSIYVEPVQYLKL